MKKIILLMSLCISISTLFFYDLTSKEKTCYPGTGQMCPKGYSCDDGICKKICNKDADCKGVKGKPYCFLGECQDKECHTSYDCREKADSDFYKICSSRGTCTESCSKDEEWRCFPDECCSKNRYDPDDKKKVICKKDFCAKLPFGD